MERCPVCSARLYSDREETIVGEFRGRTYQFCSPEHRQLFSQTRGASA